MAILKQKPNRKIALLFRFHLLAYNIGTRISKTELSNKLTNIIGEPPVILDSDQTKKSKKQIQTYLENRGYFNYVVDDSVRYKRNKKKAIVTYNLSVSNPYRINRVTVSTQDNSLLKVLQNVDQRSAPLVHIGDIYDVDLLDKERARITYEMQNSGYYFFNKNHIGYKVDTTLGNRTLNLIQLIKNPIIHHGDSISDGHHKPYKVSSVHVGYDGSEKRQVENQTLYFDSLVQRRIKENILKKSIFIKPGRTYSMKDTRYTYNRLAALNIYNQIEIQFTPVGLARDTNLLDCSIKFKPQPTQSLSFETNGTNRSGNLGLNANIIYRNKNVFKGAEIFEFKSKVGFEAQKTTADDRAIDSDPNISSRTLDQIFNTFEYGFETTVYFPDILNPFRKVKLAKVYSPKTYFSAIYNFQQRPLFSRDIVNFQYRYAWNTSPVHRFDLSVLDISSVKVNPDSLFLVRLEELQNPFLLSSYTDHLIFSSKIGYTFNNQVLNKTGNHWYLHTKLESSGGTLFLLNGLLSSPKNAEGNYELFGVRYAHYLKYDLDFRFYSTINKQSELAYRFYGGIGVPLENYDVLPFEKGYFAGGANGIRAWQVRTLGPGSYNNTSASTIDKIGDVHLEGNLEYRFHIFKLLEGAMFADAGNIWLLDQKAGDLRENAAFKFNGFLEDIAIGTGIGIRLDLSFFIVRLDWGVKVRDPALNLGEKWLFQPKTQYKLDFQQDRYPVSVFNLGIGYPF